MSYNEAIEDGVRVARELMSYKGYGNVYYPKCHVCGKECKAYRYSREKKYMCNKCKKEEEMEGISIRIDNSFDIKEEKFKEAIKRIQSKIRPKDYDSYNDSIENIHEYLHRQGWFQSTEEMMVAIQLRKDKKKFHHQVKVGRYVVDFVIPSLKVIVEVDGAIWHKNKDKDNLRDAKIILAFGPEWEIVRISDSCVNLHIPKITYGIEGILEQRRKLRAENKGSLPRWYREEY